MRSSCPDGTRADYVLCDRHGRSLAVIEAKRYSVNPADAAEQAKGLRQAVGRALYLPDQRQRSAVLGVGARKPTPIRSRPSSSRTTSNAVSPRAQLRRDPLTVPIDLNASSSATTRPNASTPCAGKSRQGRRKLLRRNGNRHRQDPHRRRAHQAAVRGQRHHPRAVPGRSHPAGQADRGCLRRASARLPGLCAACRSPLSGREAHHHHHAAKHDQHLRRLLVGLLRSGHLRRVPPQHLRQVERRAEALRRRADRPDRHALRRRLEDGQATTRTSSSCATPCASSRSTSPPSPTS